eukprot:TRINITY_DN3807_c0_g1_i2.p1 TRINITY_DN3807_c0_g1~~TRINITY_DN3807_c0_g1_i2.p1  ORF type:complete len:323 (+),score=3.62 TRINITY_DN3807_c0_g1_i2:32-970(+)
MTTRERRVKKKESEENVTVEESVTRGWKRLARKNLTTFTQAPKFLKHNEFITGGYRPGDISFKECVYSIFSLHNETTDIWTHLLATIYFLILFVRTFTVHITDPSLADVIVFSIFLGCATIQMLNSTLFHIFNCISPKWYKWTQRMDYSGISFMIIGCYIPPLYYGFICTPKIGQIYIASISILGTIGIVIGFIELFATAAFRFIRGGFYLFLGWAAVVPVVHLMSLLGTEIVLDGGFGILVMGLCYTLGCTFYMTRVPERWFPGKFNISFLSSHCIWHYFTIAAAVAQYHTLFHIRNLSATFDCSSIVGNQ